MVDTVTKANESQSIESLELPYRKKTIRGLVTAWAEYGDSSKPILIFLHGFPDSDRVWQSQIAHFSNAYHVICPCARGVSHSEKTSDLSRYGVYASTLDYLTLLDAIDPSRNKPIFVIGHDLGAAHAWGLAHSLGPRLSGLVILNGLSIPQFFRRLFRSPQWIKSWYMYLLQLPKVPEWIVSLLPIKNREENILGALNQYRAFFRESLQHLKEKPGPITSPVLTIFGNKDPYVCLPTAEELRPYATQLTIRIIKGQHWIQKGKNADEINRTLGEFFQTCLTSKSVKDPETPHSPPTLAPK